MINKKETIFTKLYRCEKAVQYAIMIKMLKNKG